MEENLYKKLKSVGASNLVFGILIILFGIGAGVMMIINGARLLAHRSDKLILVKGTAWWVNYACRADLL